MIDATKITNYNLDTYGLQQHILFWICASGKNGVTAAKSLHGLLQILKYKCNIDTFPIVNDLSPFEMIKQQKRHLVYFMKAAGIGCYNLKSKTFLDLASSNLDLKNCTSIDLENIKGIGPKTAKCFIIHTRRDAKCSGLDRHILTFLRDKGYNAPLSTPSSKKEYGRLEQIFLNLVPKDKTIAEFDLSIWLEYRSK
jgi:thermostable 8-oxoguanine DNA glycosylase